jgi:AlkA N-terminal domain
VQRPWPTSCGHVVITAGNVTRAPTGAEARVSFPGKGDAGARLSTRAPFHLEATVRVLQRRPANLVETWEQGRYLRVLRTPEDLALVEVQNRGTIDEPDVRYSLRHGDPSTGTRHRLAQTLRKVLGLDVDLVS